MFVFLSYPVMLGKLPYTAIIGANAMPTPETRQGLASLGLHRAHTVHEWKQSVPFIAQSRNLF